MAYIVRKTFDWEEDRQNYKFHCLSRILGSNYRFHRKLSWKGWLRKILRMKKPEKGV